MEADAVIVAFLGVGQKVFHSLRCIFRKKHHLDVAQGGVDDGDLAVLGWVVKLRQAALVREGDLLDRWGALADRCLLGGLLGGFRGRLLLGGLDVGAAAQHGRRQHGCQQHRQHSPCVFSYHFE